MRRWLKKTRRLTIKTVKRLAVIRPVEYNKEYVGFWFRLEEKMNYMTASQAAEKWCISQRRVQILCSQNRIKGVFKLGDNWAIPENADKPNDKRRKVADKNEQI